MAVEVKQWMAKDGTLFCDKRDAEEHERYVERIEFIENPLPWILTKIFAASLGVQPEVRANRLVRPVVLLRSPAVN